MQDHFFDKSEFHERREQIGDPGHIAGATKSSFVTGVETLS